MALSDFYRKLVEPQQVLNRKHLGWSARREAALIVGGHLLRGRTNFIKSLWKFNSVYDAERLLADHSRKIRNPIPQRMVRDNVSTPDLYIHAADCRRVVAQPTKVA